MQLTLTKATKAEFTKDYNQAFRLYIKSADTFLHISRSGSAPDKKKQQWKANAAKALERAETVKRFVDAFRNAMATTSSQSTSPGLHLTPIAVDRFAERKTDFLKFASCLKYFFRRAIICPEKG